MRYSQTAEQTGVNNMKRNTEKRAVAASLVFVFVLAFTLAIAPSQASAQAQGLVFNPVNVRSQLYVNGTSLISIETTCKNNGTESVSEIPLRIDSTDAQVLEAKVDGIDTTAELIEQERYSVVAINLSSPLLAGQQVQILLVVMAEDLQSSTGSSLTGEYEFRDFVFYARPLSDYYDFSLNVILPEGASLSQESVTPIFPSSNENYTNGRSIAFVWYVAELHPGQEKVFIIRYQSLNSATYITGLQGFQLILLTSALLFGGFFLGYISPRLFQWVRRLGRVKIVGVTSEEEEVLAVIRGKGGTCSQKELYTSLGMSQSKASLVLAALEERGLVRRFKDGRENTVHIVEE
jgi:uncharacterized membrane protein